MLFFYPASKPAGVDFSAVSLNDLHSVGNALFKFTQIYGKLC